MPSKRTQSGDQDSRNPDRAERTLIRQLRRRAADSSSSGVRLGIGDDCALLRLRPGEELAVTTDLSIAGRHFRLDLHPPESVGHRTLARGLSDLAAMGARPVAAFLSLGLPGELTLPEIPNPSRTSHKDSSTPSYSSTWMSRFLDGLLALADRYKTPLAGGDLAESPLAVADIVLTGAVRQGQALLRSGAHPGDLIYVTGTLGGAAAALAKLLETDRIGEGPGNSLQGSGFRLSTSSSASPWSGSGAIAASRIGSARSGAAKKTEPAEAPVLTPHLFPEPRVAQGLWLVRHRAASAAIDISDGISTELTHLCDESHVSGEIDSALLPIHPGATLAQALHGGEDYELLFTAPASFKMPRTISGIAITRIGCILKSRRNQPAVNLLTERGPQPLKPQGWEHFS